MILLLTIKTPLNTILILNFSLQEQNIFALEKVSLMLQNLHNVSHFLDSDNILDDLISYFHSFLQYVFFYQ